MCDGSKSKKGTRDDTMPTPENGNTLAEKEEGDGNRDCMCTGNMGDKTRGAAWGAEAAWTEGAWV